MISKITDKKQIEFLFEGWEESCIWSCLQGVMGDIYANEDKSAAAAVIGDFAFYAGEPDDELVVFTPEDFPENFIIMVPQNKAWEKCIERVRKENAKKVIRYAIKKEGDIFDREKLRKAVDDLPSQYTLQMIDEKTFSLCLHEEWSKYFVCNYKDFKEFKAKNGLGVLVFEGDKMVAGVSSYSSYREGIEIEVDTSETYRRQGLAYACSARLILECLERDLYPNWDAQNRWSVGLAEKLGYHYSHEYTSYEITDF